MMESFHSRLDIGGFLIQLDLLQMSLRSMKFLDALASLRSILSVSQSVTE